MADDIRVRFNADASSYNNEIKKLVAQNKALQSEMKKTESSFTDQMSEEEKAAKKKEVLNKQIEAQNEYINALNAQMKKLTDSEKDTTEQELRLQDQINKADAALNDMNAQMNAAESATNDYGAEAEDATGKTGEFVTELSKMEAQKTIADILGQIGDKFAEVGQKALDAAKELDEGYDTIIKKTGASGEELAGMQDVADELFGSMPANMADIGTAVGEVNTRFGLTGDELRDVSKNFLQFAKITDTDVNSAVGSTSKILKAYGGDIEDADKLLGYLAKQSQITGIDTGTLMSSLEQNGAVLREMGFDVQESTALLASFEANGVDASAAMTGFKKAIANGAKEGKDANAVISEMVDGIQNASTDTEALAIATELFGTRGAVVMADGIRDGRINLNDLSDSLDNYGDVVSDTFEETLDPWDKSAVAINNVKIAGKELAGEALEAIQPLLEDIVKLVQSAVKWFRNLPDPVKKVIGVIGLLGVGAGKVVPKVSSLFSTIQQFKSAKAIIELSKLQSAAGELGTSTSKAGGLLNSGFLGPIGAVSAASVAFVAAMAAIDNAISDHIEAEYGLTEEEQAVINKINEASQAYDDMAAARDEAVGNVQAEYDRIEELAREYDTLVDANGKVKEGYEDRANYILTEMAKATDKSVEDIQKEIDANGSLVDAIQDVIDKKRAEATLSAYESAYAEAVQNEKKALQDLMDAQDVANQRQQAYNQTQAELNGYYKRRAELEAQIEQARGRGDYERLTGQLTALEASYDGLLAAEQASKTALDQANASVQTASATYEGYNNTIANYEGLSAAIISGDQTKINEALTLLVNNFQTAANGTEESLQKQVDDAKTYLGQMEKAFAEGKIDQASLDAARKAVAAAEKELKKLKDVGKGGGDGLVKGMSEAERSMVNKAIEFGRKAVQSVAKGAETNSPSKATIRTGKDIDAGLNQGMESGKAGVTAKGKEVGTAATTGITTTATTGVQGYGTSLANLVKAGLDAGKSGVTSSANGIATAANTNVKPSDSGVKAAGEALGTALKTGLDNKKSSVETAASGLKTATEKAKTSYDTAKGWGENVGEGLAKGMEAKYGRVGDAALGLATKTKTKVKGKSGLNINSPSKVMEELGKFAVEGFAIGLDDSKLVSKAVERMVMPTMQIPASNTVNRSLTYGDIIVNVSGANIQNEQALAKAVSDQIFRRVQAQKAVWA